MTRIELLGLGYEELEKTLIELGLPRFRASQIFHWIYKHQVTSFYDMANLPKPLREELRAQTVIGIPRVVRARISKDGTRKFLLELIDKKQIEVVAIPQARQDGRRYTACLSSQVGCPLGCAFCATGQSGFERDLTASEIVGQLVAIEKEIRTREKRKPEERVFGNVVFMGMGEPLLNLEAVLQAIRMINDERGIGIGQRHITISTAGLIPGIRALAAADLQITLAISLHATTDEVRSRLIPINRKYPIRLLMESIADYTSRTGRRATFEYLLLKGINDNPADAVRLAAMVKSHLANINLIPFNQTDGCDYQRPDQEVIKGFYHRLQDEGVNVTLREEMGTDIEAACGQLRNRQTMFRKQEIASDKTN